MSSPQPPRLKPKVCQDCAELPLTKVIDDDHPLQLPRILKAVRWS
jgi:hypothetical protein